MHRASVTLDSYSFTPAHLIVQAGKPVELTLTSAATVVPHNLILKDPAAGPSVAQDVGPRETAKVSFTPTKPGTYVFYLRQEAALLPEPPRAGHGRPPGGAAVTPGRFDPATARKARYIRGLVVRRLEG